MASSFTASSSSASMVARVNLVPTPRIVPSMSLGSLAITKEGQVRCSLKIIKSSKQENECYSSVVNPASVIAAVTSAATAAMWSPAALALVDERMSTEGTGLPFGLSNNLLGWLLAGVFGVIWSFYFVYTTELDEDEDSGLSL
ncbi:Photosystem II reaction center W protein, chloroplastic-like protein [Drosera capensis]